MRYQKHIFNYIGIHLSIHCVLKIRHLKCFSNWSLSFTQHTIRDLLNFSLRKYYYECHTSLLFYKYVYLAKTCEIKCHFAFRIYVLFFTSWMWSNTNLFCWLASTTESYRPVVVNWLCIVVSFLECYYIHNWNLTSFWMLFNHLITTYWCCHPSYEIQELLWNSWHSSFYAFCFSFSCVAKCSET